MYMPFGTIDVNITYSNIGLVSGTTISDSSNLNVDPEFVDPDAGDYHLRPDSPLLGAGICGRIPEGRIAPYKDFEGDRRAPGELRCDSWTELGGRWSFYVQRRTCGEGIYTGCSIGADDKPYRVRRLVRRPRPYFRISR